VCWGENTGGQFGDGSITSRSVAVEVSSLSGVTALAAGGNHTCVLTSGSGPMCSGENTNGQLGNGSAIESDVPVTVGP
jgi:alpha-tubulin suppressor-like RCC1 family protein